MLNKNVSFKCSESFIGKADKNKTFSIEITVKANHVIDNTTLNTIEQQILGGLRMNLYDYSILKKTN